MTVPVKKRRIKLRKLLSVLLLTIALLTVALTRPANAADTVSGAKIFSANCAACHVGGGNVIMANKTLKKDALDKYGMYSMDAIVNQVMNGKNAMPAFKGRLNKQQIEDVAAYVMEKAAQGW